MAERNLATLLATLDVRRHDGVWAFVSTEAVEASSDAIMRFQEREGWAEIRPATVDTEKQNRWVWLEVSVYSDLNAVGFLAALSDALAAADIPCNAVAAYHHDHIFVPVSRADDAIAAIVALKEQSA